MAHLNYAHLRYFWVVAREGNLTRAAAKLNVSQSTLSVQIKQLEEQLGQALFERRNRQLLLTEAGRIALDHADSIFGLGEELLETLGRQTGTGQTLTVGAISTLSRNFQVAFLSPLLGRSDVRIILRSGNLAALQQDLEAHRIDLVLSNRLPPQDSEAGWVSHLIDQQPVSLIGRPHLAPADGGFRALLEQAPLILPTADSSIRIGFDALADRLRITPRIAAEVDDMAMIRLLARENAGIAVIPSIVVRDELAQGLLTEFASLRGLVETFYVITQTRRFPNPLIRTLIQDAGIRIGAAPGGVEEPGAALAR
jgi:LysR family transcriptional activator of nhaA